MGIEILVSLLSGVLSLVLGGLASTELIRKLFRLPLRNSQGTPVTSYHDRLARLTDTLAKSSAEVDLVLAEIAKVSKDQAAAVAQLETELETLGAQERELQDRIQTLKSVPIAVAEHFAALTIPGEMRSAKRDYLLFGAGVVVSTVTAIVLHLAGLT
jgi:hypothetical protein